MGLIILHFLGISHISQVFLQCMKSFLTSLHEELEQLFNLLIQFSSSIIVGKVEVFEFVDVVKGLVVVAKIVVEVEVTKCSLVFDVVKNVGLLEVLVSIVVVVDDCVVIVVVVVVVVASDESGTRNLDIWGAIEKCLYIRQTLSNHYLKKMIISLFFSQFFPHLMSFQ